MSNKLNKIKDISSLEELSKFDDIIREQAKRLIKCPETADDLVNDMYIKLHKTMVKGTVINGGYVHITLKNLYTNYLKFQVNRYDRGDSIYEASIPDLEDTFLETFEEKLLEEELYLEIENRINNLTWYEKKILEFENSISLLELSKQSGITYRSLCYSRDKMRDKLGVIKKHHADSKNNPLNKQDEE